MRHDLKLAEVLYNAYKEKAGGKSLISGAPLPAFADLNQDVRDAWVAVADAAVMYKKANPFDQPVVPVPVPDVYFYNENGKPFDVNKDYAFYYKDPKDGTWWNGGPAQGVGFGMAQLNPASYTDWMKDANLEPGTLNILVREDFHNRFYSDDPRVRQLLDGTVLVNGKLPEQSK